MHVNLQPPTYSEAIFDIERSLAANDSTLQPAYSSMVYQLSPVSYGCSINLPPVDAYSDKQFAPPAFGQEKQQTAPLPQWLSHQEDQVNVSGFTASHKTAIITQPAPIVRWPATYMGWSIFSFICCFWPLGLAAIIYSLKVVWARDHVEAKKLSLITRNLNVAATAITPILVIIVVSVMVGSAATRSAASGSLYLLGTYMNDPYYSHMYHY